MGLETGGTLISGIIYLRWKMDGLISAGGGGGEAMTCDFMV